MKIMETILAIMIVLTLLTVLRDDKLKARYEKQIDVVAEKIITAVENKTQRK